MDLLDTLNNASVQNPLSSAAWQAGEPLKRVSQDPAYLTAYNAAVVAGHPFTDVGELQNIIDGVNVSRDKLVAIGVAAGLNQTDTIRILDLTMIKGLTLAERNHQGSTDGIVFDENILAYQAAILALSSSDLASETDLVTLINEVNNQASCSCH